MLNVNKKNVQYLAPLMSLTVFRAITNGQQITCLFYNGSDKGVFLLLMCTPSS